MRGYKPISFDEFAGMCQHSECGEFETFCNKLPVEPVSGWSEHCRAGVCPLWRSLGRADLAVVKVTASNSPSTSAIAFDNWKHEHFESYVKDSSHGWLERAWNAAWEQAIASIPKSGTAH